MTANLPTQLEPVERDRRILYGTAFLTGNGLTVSEDLARRFVAVDFDARTEDPEARPFAR